MNAVATLPPIKSFEEFEREVGPILAPLPRMRVYFVGDDDPPPTDFLVEGLIPLAAVTFLFGEPGSGKSILVTDLVRAVATSEEWLGRSVMHGGALVVAPERGSLTRERLARTLSSPAPVAVIPGAIDLRKEDAGELIEDAARYVERRSGVPVRLVVLDTFAAATVGVDENSVAETGRALRTLSTIAGDLGAAVVVVHHSRKDGTAMRGSSSILGAADAALRLDRDRRSRFLVVEKLNAIAFAPEPLRFEIRDGGLRGPIVGPVGYKPAENPEQPMRLPRDAATALRALVDLGGGAPVTEWRTATINAFGDRKSGALRQAFVTAKRNLLDADLIVETDDRVSVSNRQNASDFSNSDATGNTVSASASATRPMGALTPDA